MSRIEIRLDGKPVGKIAVARALSKVGGVSVRVCELGEDGSIMHDVDVYARHRAFGGVRGPEVNWSAVGSVGSVGAAEARRYAEMISLAAELAEMADMTAG
jgi:hypothetical protein